MQESIMLKELREIKEMIKTITPKVKREEAENSHKNT